MNYDVVIATRNRPEALRISIPLILNQTLAPRKLIIVDSSDDHERIQKTVLEFVGGHSVNFEILESKANLPRQRNLGLKKVESPIVMFPDDDSLWWPGVAEAITRIYEQDEKGIIGGVTGLEVFKPPVPIQPHKGIYKKSYFDKIKAKMVSQRNKFESYCFPKPFNLMAYECWRKLPCPEWLYDINAVLVETLGGFRMSFRTAVLVAIGGFDETLGGVVGYAQHEDMAASIAVQAKGYLLAGAHDAKIYHHRFPSKRANGYAYGFCQIFNYIYICCKYFNRYSKAWKALPRFIKYKIFLYSIGKTRYEQERYLGAKEAWRLRHTLVNSLPNKLSETYYNVCGEAIGNRNK